MSARPATDVAVFTTSLPAVQYVEVGILQAQQSSDLSLDQMPEIVAKMRAAAGRRGCDGLIINGTRDRSATNVASSRDTTSVSTSTLEGYWGSCIMFVEPAVAAR